MQAHKFELRAPSDQTAVDIFLGRWTANLRSVCGVEGTGTVNLFEDDRIMMAANSLGTKGRFDGYSILELGPLEGAQTHQMERLGATRIVAVESNTEAFLKCLVVKEILNLRARFLCGDAIEFLRNSHEHFDLVFCSGLLYHLSDPLEMIKQICIHGDRCFVWSHYFLAGHEDRIGVRTPRVIGKNGFVTTYHETEYSAMEESLFVGGNKLTHAWMHRDEIIRAFAHFGMVNRHILADEPNQINGPAFSCAFARA